MTTNLLEDIKAEKDIELLIDLFYKRVLIDPVIGFIFKEVVALSWEKHIPIMNAFWNSILLGAGTYNGNPMIKHIELDKKTPLTKLHFDRWLQLWEESIIDNFSGEKANEAITRAKNIAALMVHKIAQHNQDEI